MSGFQSPQMLTDLYRDLRDRRLLPLVVVLVVGIAVVPMALTSKPDDSGLAPPSPTASVTEKSKVPSANVVVSDAGVRDFTRRLKGDHPKDPFIPVFAPESAPSDASTASTASATAAGATTPSSESSGASAGGTTTAPPSTGSGGSSGGGTASQPQTESRFYHYRIKVRAGKASEDLKTYDSVGSLKQLPSDNVPALAFLGVTTKSDFQPKTAVFLVSSSVSSIDGEGSCTFAGTYCQLLSLKPGEHEDLVWTDGEIYRVELVKFNLIVRHNPPDVSGQGNSGGGGDGSAGRSSRTASWYFSF
jgi:hypothetical protein